MTTKTKTKARTVTNAKPKTSASKSASSVASTPRRTSSTSATRSTSATSRSKANVSAAKSRRSAGIGDEAVKAATGCDWARWIDALDRSGCKTKTHKEIVAVITASWPEVGPWWTQMVAVGYEQARGLRAKNQAASGFQVSSSKTVDVGVRELFAAWKDPRQRAQWLPDAAFTVRKATPPKSLRITWIDGKTTVEANFTAKGASKSQVAVQHNKLANAREVAELRKHWSGALGKLKTVLER